jgi:hypothetical protein
VRDPRTETVSPVPRSGHYSNRATDVRIESRP